MMPRQLICGLFAHIERVVVGAKEFVSGVAKLMPSCLRKTVSGIVPAPLPLFWGVSKTAQSSMDLRFNRGAAGDYRPAARRAGRRPGAGALLEREAGEGRGRGAVIGTSATAAVMKAAGSRL
jgi:hypothetical protein